jgi:excisionase family DNA binding protein
MSIIKKLRERTEPFNVSEVANLLSVTEATVQRWARQRQIPCIRIGDTIRFDPSLLADFIDLQAARTRMSARYLHPRPAGNPDDYQMKWEDLGELAPEEFRKQKDGAR